MNSKDVRAKFNPFDLESEDQSQAAAHVSLGPQAQKMVDRAALVRQIEQRLGIHHIQLQQGDDARGKNGLPATWEDLEPSLKHRARIPALQMGQAQLPSKPAALTPEPARKGLAADLHALEVLRARAAEKPTEKAPAVSPKPAKPRAKRAVKTEPKAVLKAQPKAAVKAPPKAAAKQVATKAPPRPAPKSALKSAPLELSEFLETPSYLQVESRAQADLAGFFMDEFQVLGFKDRILNERQNQTPLRPRFFKAESTSFNFEAQAHRPDLLRDASALFNEQDLETWVEQLEQHFPPLYKQESRAERLEISPRTRESLKALPLIGRNVTVGSMLNSWKLMGGMGRARSLLLQPDFLRLDQQETFEHEIFLGQTALPAHRNHTLFKPKDMEGYLSNTALHLYRPRQLLAPHEDAEAYFARLHPIQKRSFTEPAFGGWFDKVFTTALSHVTLIESFSAEVVNRYTMVQRKLLKQARAVSLALMEELESSGTLLRQDSAFKMQFFQRHGFVPSATFYEFLACPVRGLASDGGLPMPLWQALGQGHEVQWKNILLEEQPVDLVLIHFLALYAQNPTAYDGLVPTLGMLDLITRCGDFLQEQAPVGSKSEQIEQEKSLALLKAYEHLMIQEELRTQPDSTHRLGCHHILWDKQSRSTLACSAFLTQPHQQLLQEVFGGLRQTLEGTGLWRDEIVDWANLLGREFGLVN